ncbi:MAG TPA: hypothetical protein VGC09_06475 [Rhodopila sp.]
MYRFYKATFVTHAFDSILHRLDAPGPRPNRQAPAGDIVLSLRKLLGSGWWVERETDYLGEISIVVLPATDQIELPMFMLYESGGLAHVATIRADEWEADRGFDTVPQAALIGIVAVIADLTLTPEPVAVRRRGDGSLPRHHRHLLG